MDEPGIVGGVEAAEPVAEGGSAMRTASRTWLELLQGGLVPTVVVGAGLAAGSVPVGGHAVAGVLTGSVLAAAAMALGPLTLRLGRDAPDLMLFALGIAAYGFAVFALLVAFVFLNGASWLDPTYVAVGILAGVLAWTAGQVRATAKLRVPVFGSPR